jgi:hypothetical protein
LRILPLQHDLGRVFRQQIHCALNGHDNVVRPLQYLAGGCTADGG